MHIVAGRDARYFLINGNHAPQLAKYARPAAQLFCAIGRSAEKSLESGELSVILPGFKIMDMSEQKYFAPECILLDTECEGVLCSSSFELPDSNWIGEKEL